MGEIIRKSSTEISIAANRINIPSNLPITNRKRDIYLSNKNFPKIKDIEDKNIVVSEIHAYINMTMMDKGTNYDPDEIQILLKRVTDDIMREFSTYSLEEIRLAFYYGVRGELGEYYGLYPVTFYNWLKKYRFELMPPITREVKHLLPDPKETIKSQQEIDKGLSDVLCKVYFNLCVDGNYSFFDGGNLGYHLLENLGLLNLSPSDKLMLMDKARADIKIEIRKEDAKLRNHGRKYQRIDLSKAMKQIENESNPQYEHRVKSRAMRIAVHDYLLGLAKEDVDFKILIDGALANKNYNTDEKD